MDVIKMDSLEKIATSMTKVFGIGCTLTDAYEYKGRAICAKIDVKNGTMSLLDAVTKETIGSSSDVSALRKSLGSYRKFVEPITKLIENNIG